MAITTGTQLKMVQVSTQAKYNDITNKDPGTLYWVVETRKIYLDGVPYGFNNSDVNADLLNNILDVSNKDKPVILTFEKSTDEKKLILKADVNISDDGTGRTNLIEKSTTGGLIVPSDTIVTIVNDGIDNQVISKLGQTNGIAELDAAGKVPTNQLPSFVDDVLEFSKKSAFPATGEAGKIYVATDTNITYRWGGTAYVEISPTLAIGTTSSTAFRGDYGNTAYLHVSKKDNPHGVTKAQVGLGDVANYGLATQEQAELGNSTVGYMTPQRTKQAIDKLAPKVTWTVID